MRPPFPDRILGISGVSMDYRMTYLGQIRQPFPLLCSSMDNPVDVQIVDVVEEAQLKGELCLPFCPYQSVFVEASFRVKSICKCIMHLLQILMLRLHSDGGELRSAVTSRKIGQQPLSLPSGNRPSSTLFTRSLHTWRENL